MASATGPSDARYETTAAYAAIETSNPRLQNDVERNALHAHSAAEDAAHVAKYKAPSAQLAVNDLEDGLAAKTDEAVAEGKVNTAGYVQQAREIAGSALATAASYLPTSITGPVTDSTTATDAPSHQQGGTGVMANIQSAAGTAVETARTVLSSAQQTVQPHLETAKQVVQPHIETAKQTVQPHINSAKAAIYGTTDGVNGHGDSAAAVDQKREIPATTAPLQSGGGVMGGPYTKTGEESQVANL